MMKKINVTFIFLMLCAVVLVFGCSKKDENSVNADNNVSVENAEEASNGEADLSTGKLVFSTTDLEGNTVTEAIFNDYEVTLVNVWGTFCGPCKAELPDLEKAYQEYSQKNCNVLGFTSDLYEGDEEVLALAKTIWADSGCTFKTVKSVQEFDSIYSQLTGVPTSFLVNKNGEIIPGSFHTGRLDKQGFVDMLEAALVNAAQ